MKNSRKARTGIGALLLGLVIFGFTACSNPASEDGRTPVQDGTFITEGVGKSVTTPITVSTTFTNNTLIDISVGANGETGPILDSVTSLMVPRIIEAQSLAVCCASAQNRIKIHESEFLYRSNCISSP